VNPMLCIDERPIIALCTPQGSGAIALIRISGEGVIQLVDRMARLSSGKSLVKQGTHTIHHGYVIDNTNNMIDEVLFLLMKAPKTFTGQDTIEISCHNNPFIIEQVIQQAISHGAHQAQRGEFTKRAFLHDKIDLLQAEAINDLISAQNELALKKSMAQLKGTLSDHIHQIEQDLISLVATTEASFEFLDEEQRDIDFDSIIKEKIKQLIEKTNTINANFSVQQQIKQGIRIALLGSVNVGKSTLFNALVNKERAIVTDSPGTTRDAIETTIYKHGNFWLFIDTAGLRNTNDEIEQKGIDQTWQEAAQSDIILLVSDVTQQAKQENVLYKQIQKQFGEKVLMVVNKIDQLDKAMNANQENSVWVSGKEKMGIDVLEQAINKKIANLFEYAQAPFLLNKRHHNVIFQLNQKLKTIVQECTNSIQYELVAYQLKEMLELVAQLTGKTISERIMDNVFKSFCVGK